MKLLSEVRAPAQVLSFALSRERGQENQREILRSNPSNWNQVNATTQQNLRPQIRQQTNVQQQQTSQEIQPCWRSAAPFNQGHNNICPAKKLNVTSVKRWDILLNYAGRKSQRDQIHVNLNEVYNKHTPNPQSSEKPNKTCAARFRAKSGCNPNKPGR